MFYARQCNTYTVLYVVHRTTYNLQQNILRTSYTVQRTIYNYNVQLVKYIPKFHCAYSGNYR